MRKRILGFIVTVVVLIAALIYSQHSAGPFKVSGYIEADDARVGSRIGGRVRAVHVEEGQKVKAGDALIELEPFDLQERRAEAAAQLAAKRADFEKMSHGFRSEEIAEAKARRDQLEAQYERLVNGPRKQEIAAAEAQLRLAEANLELAQTTYNRTSSMLIGDATSRQQLDQTIAELKVATQTVELRHEDLSLLREGTRREEIAQAKAQLDEADQVWKLRSNGYRSEEIAQARASMEAAQASLDSIDRQMEELVIKAPTEGVIEAVDLEPGDLVAPNAPVLSLLDTTHLWVRAYVPENRLNLEIGHKVTISVDALPGVRFRGHVTFIAREAEFTPSNAQTPEERSKQVFRIKVTLDEGMDRLRPGMSADVWIERGDEDP